MPGAGFGRSGHMRLSLTVPHETIEKALPGFEQAYREAAGVGAGGGFVAG